MTDLSLADNPCKKTRKRIHRIAEEHRRTTRQLVVISNIALLSNVRTAGVAS